MVLWFLEEHQYCFGVQNHRREYEAHRGYGFAKPRLGIVLREPMNRLRHDLRQGESYDTKRSLRIAFLLFGVGR